METNIEFRILRRLRSGALLVREIWDGGFQDLAFNSTEELITYAGNNIPVTE